MHEQGIITPETTPRHLETTGATKRSKYGEENWKREKQKEVGTVERGRAGDWREVTNSLMSSW